MRIDAALADQLQAWQTFEQISLNFGALPNEHQAFGVLQAGCQRVGVLHMIVPNDDGVSCQFMEAWQCSYRVKIIVEDRDLHKPLFCAG